MTRFLKQGAVDHGSNHSHDHQVHAKGRICIDRQYTARTCHKHHCRVNQHIEGIHSQQTRRNNGIIDNGLKHNRCTADGKSGNQHGNQLGGSDTHSI